ncbi:MAG TPA: hypothetical protein PK370_02235 [Candidatus Woesebacteria bacterium]|nr:hypothetical protein [Candidatus Woesebacteria bacterium]
MENKKYLKFLIPLVAVVVIIESVILIGRSSANKKVVVDNNKPVEVETKVVDLKLESATNELKMNGTATVNLLMSMKEKKSLDSLAYYVKYDPTAFEVTNLKLSDRLPKPTFSKVSTNKSMIVANFMVADQKGLSLSDKEKLTVMSFDITAKKTGKFNFEISSGNEAKESVTMFVENATSKVLPYSSNQLTINVSR